MATAALNIKADVDLDVLRQCRGDEAEMTEPQEIAGAVKEEFGWMNSSGMTVRQIDVMNVGKAGWQ